MPPDRGAPHPTAPSSFEVERVAAELARDGRLYGELLRVPTMSVGVYRLAVGAIDPQAPHREDELYVVVRGRARFRVLESERRVSRGDLLFVPARQPHRFEEVEEELVLLVVFAPAETHP